MDPGPREPPRVGGVSPGAGQTLRPGPHPQEARQDSTLMAQGISRAWGWGSQRRGVRLGVPT